MEISLDQIRELILDRRSSSDIKRAATAEGMVFSMVDEGEGEGVKSMELTYRRR